MSDRMKDIIEENMFNLELKKTLEFIKEGYITIMEAEMSTIALLSHKTPCADGTRDNLYKMFAIINSKQHHSTFDSVYNNPTKLNAGKIFLSAFNVVNCLEECDLYCSPHVEAGEWLIYVKRLDSRFKNIERVQFQRQLGNKEPGCRYEIVYERKKPWYYLF